MIALDSSVLIDTLIADPCFAQASEACIEQALAKGEVVVCEAVVAEVQAMLDTKANLMEVLEQLGIRYEPTSQTAAMRAGHMYQRFGSRKEKRERVMAEFLIGAHALLQCSALITRDSGFYRDYFKGLKIIDPTH